MRHFGNVVVETSSNASAPLVCRWYVSSFVRNSDCSAEFDAADDTVIFRDVIGSTTFTQRVGVGGKAVLWVASGRHPRRASPYDAPQGDEITVRSYDAFGEEGGAS